MYTKKKKVFIRYPDKKQDIFLWNYKDSARILCGNEAATDLVRGYLRDPKARSQSDTSHTTRNSGSGRPLPAFRCRHEPQKDD